MRQVTVGLSALLWLLRASGSSAQSVSVEEHAPTPPRAAPTVKPPAAADSAPPPSSPAVSVVPPVAVSTPVSYPEGARGEAEVVLLLTISTDGTVSEVSVVQGVSPFAEHALQAARDWKFRAATRGERAISAKIRFVVRFTPPPEPEDIESRVPPLAEQSEPSAKPAQSAPVPRGPYEILVLGKREPQRQRLGRAEIHDMPGAFGDPYRAIEALPGVVPIVSGVPYFYVRGAPPGNVGYFFDGVPVPYLYHFAAGPGVLHPAFVEHVDLYPGAYPVRYGRFAGGIVAGEMAEPNQRFRGEASIRIVDSGAMFETPFANGRGSLMVGGRYSYTGLVLSLIVPEVTLNYWDYQARVRYALGDADRVEVLFLGARDYLSQKEQSYYDVGSNPDVPSGSSRATSVTHEDTVADVAFHRMDLRWDHRIDRGNWRNAVLLGLDRTGVDDGQIEVKNYLLGARSERTQRLAAGSELRLGADLLFETLSQKLKRDQNGDFSGVDDPPPPSRPDNGSSSDQTQTPVGDAAQNDDDPDFGLGRSRNDFTAGTWAELVVQIARGVRLTPGVRADLYVSDEAAVVAFEPRVSVVYELSNSVSIAHGLAVVHQAPSFVVAIPGFKPTLAGGLQRSLQHSAGVSFRLPEEVQGSVTVFQNAFFKMTDFLGVAQLQDSAGQKVQDLRATGHAYGLEVMLRRSLSRDLGGFLSYTLSRSVRTSGNLEGPATTDRTHVLNLGASYNLGRNWRAGARWMFYSGIPSEVAYIEAAKAPPRTPPYWRLDCKLQKRWYIADHRAWWGLTLEVLNTTLNKEPLNGDCNAYGCKHDKIGPVTVPSIGAEGAF